jgi:hypothetical protein
MICIEVKIISILSLTLEFTGEGGYVRKQWTGKTARKSKALNEEQL